MSKDKSKIDLSSEMFVRIKTDKPNARKIINRFITEGWWITHTQEKQTCYLIISSAINLQKDIKDRIKGVEFTVE